jgi:hypothetical protein
MTAPQPADPLREALENDIRELAGATPGELAARLVERGWQRQADHATLGLRQAVIDAAIAWRADPFGIHDDPPTPEQRAVCTTCHLQDAVDALTEKKP